MEPFVIILFFLMCIGSLIANGYAIYKDRKEEDLREQIRNLQSEIKRLELLNTLSCGSCSCED